MNRRLLAAAALAFMLAVPACSSESAEPEATTTTQATAATSTAVVDDPQWCSPTATYETPWIEQALVPLTLPAPARIVGEQTLANTDDRSTVDVIVRICGQGITGDELKDVGTDIAQALRAAPEGDTIASLRVSNNSHRDDDTARIRCEDFQVYSWDDAAAVSPRTNWKTGAES